MTFKLYPITFAVLLIGALIGITSCNKDAQDTYRRNFRGVLIQLNHGDTLGQELVDIAMNVDKQQVNFVSTGFGEANNGFEKNEEDYYEKRTLSKTYEYRRVVDTLHFKVRSNFGPDSSTLRYTYKGTSF